MSTTTAVVAPVEKAIHIGNIFEGLEALGCQLAMAADGIRDGIVLKPVLKTQSLAAQEFCLAAGVLVAEGWLRMVMVQGQLKGFIRAYPKASALEDGVLRFPQGKCERGKARATPAVLIELGKH